jgi:predicted DNA binding CopG/RHH family protein
MARKFNSEEELILDLYEKGRLKRVEDFPKEKAKAISAAKNTIKLLRKDQRLNIRLSSGDLSGIKRIALEEGLPYQTLISSILHKFVAKHEST